MASSFIPICTVVLLASGVVFLLLPSTRRWGQQFGRTDRSVSRLGGAAVACGVLFTTGLGLTLEGVGTVDWMNWLWYFVGAAGVLALGIFDDLRGLTALQKLWIQVAIALVLWAGGLRIETLPMPWGTTWILSWGVSISVTVIWIVGVTNAMNLVDGMDALAGSIGWLAALAFGIIAALVGRMDLLIITTALLGALTVFLRFNWRPASIHLGDGGSLFLGFSFAILGVQIVQRPVSESSALMPLLVLVVPLSDMTFAVVRRVWTHRSPLERDRGHIHHRLVRSGWTPVQTVWVLSIITLVGCVAAVALQLGIDVSWVLGSSAIVLAGILSVLRGVHRRHSGSSGANVSTPAAGSRLWTKAGRS